MKKEIFRILISIVLLVLAMILPNNTICLVLFIMSYIVASFKVYVGLFKKEEKCECDACKGKEKFSIFSENFLMIIASISAFLLGDFKEACAVMIFFSIGEVFEDYAVEKSRRNIADLMDIRPDTAKIMDEEGNLISVSPSALKVGAIIYVEPGDKVPLDGILVSEEGKFDTSALTGESKVRTLVTGDTVLSGFINVCANNREIMEAKSRNEKILPGTICLEVTAEFSKSTASKILDLVENAKEKKSKSEAFITRFARIYTPLVVAMALLLLLVPWAITLDFKTWAYRALTFLVISCPCALVISIPLGFFAGLGCASRNGILIKGSNYLETLSKVNIIAFDKTGTLTFGNVGDDRLKPTVHDAISSLKKVGVKYTIMLTGDTEEIAKTIAKEAGVDDVLYELLPEDKVNAIYDLLSKKDKKDVVAYVGDGINDAPVLMAADIGISMGKIGTDAAVEASDVVLMDDDPRKIEKAVRIAKKCLRIVKENIYLALLVKLSCLILGAFGIASLWLSIFADVGVMVLAVLNATRALK